MIRELSVGEGIEAQCTKCKALLNHTIVAMVDGKVVRVKCNTCGGEHNYRAAKSPAEPVKRSTSAKSVAGAPRKTPKEKAETTDRAEWEEFSLTMDMAKAVSYNMTGKFRINALVAHPVFGVGIVKSTQDNKMDVLFQAGRKLLRCG